MPRPLKAVLVGFGSIGQGLATDPQRLQWYRYSTHAQVLRDHPSFDWQAVVDPSGEALASARDRWQVPEAVASVDNLAERESFDLAVLATPPDVRADIINRLPGLKAVLLEKPLADSAGAGQELLRICRSRGILVQVNFLRRADDLFRRLAGGELERLIGRVQAGHGVYGGGLSNNGSHLIDLIRMLLGEVADVIGAGRVLGSADDPTVSFGVRLSGGADVYISGLDFQQYREIALTVWGTAGKLEILHGGLVNFVTPAGPHRALTGRRELVYEQREQLQTTLGDAFYAVYDNLADVLQGRAALVSDGANAQRVLEIIDRVKHHVYGQRTGVR